MSYTEEEIREAARELWPTASGSQWISQLLDKMAEQREKKDHGFADTDTITVKELRDAYTEVGETGDGWDDDSLLTCVRAQRRGRYRPGQVVRDADGEYWKFLLNGTKTGWLRFGSDAHWGYGAPRWPLEVMP